MKLTILIMTICLLQVSAASNAQITLNTKSESLNSVLKSVARQSGYDFIYASEDVRGLKVENIKLNNVSIEQALKTLLGGQPLEYELADKTVMLQRKQQKGILDRISDYLASIDVNGRVLDQDGAPIPGVTVKLKNTDKIVITDGNGRFQLKNIEPNAIIVVSYVGFDAQEIEAKENLTIRMVVATSKLDEVQIQAYGTTTRRLSTSNIGSIKADQIASQPVNNILTALQGRVPGLFIQQTTGLAGGNVNVTIQGLNSMSNGNLPFYVVDGVPYNPQQISSPVLPSIFPGTARSTMQFINPADIESVEFLKDADATAIYGSRAANGAILITTKKGKAGKTRVEISSQNGWGKVAKFVDMMNTEQYLAYRRERYANDGTTPSATDYDINGTWDQNRYTDWQRELIGGTSRFTNLQGSISGGNQNTQFLAGGGYMRETTVMRGDFSDTKGNFHFDVNHRSSNQKFSFNLSGTYVKDRNTLPNVDLTQATILAPNAPALYNSDGSLNWAPLASNPASSTFDNPLAPLYRVYTGNTDNLIANTVIGYKILEGLEIRSSFGYNRLQSDETLLTPQSSYAPSATTNFRSNAYSNKFTNSLIIEPQLTYNKNFSFGKLDFLVGATYQQSDNNLRAFRGSNYTNDSQIQSLTAASTLTATSALMTKYRYNAVFGRINYQYKDRYILNLTARRDGSSRFGPENLFSNFYSVGGAWIFSEEKFIKDKLSFLDYGKIRATYGTTGNDQIGEYAYLNLYNNVNVTVPYQSTIGILPAGHANPYVQWEQTNKLNFGLDFGFIKNKLLVNVNYFRNRSSNQLLGTPLPSFTGFQTVTANLPATVQNTGWEFQVDASPITRDKFSWKISANMTIPKNRLVSFPGLAQSTLATTYFIGQPTNVRLGYNYLGVSPQTGLFQFQKGDGTITSDIPTVATDRIAYFDENPKFYGGISNTISYRNFGLDFLFQGAKQIGTNFLFGSGAPGLINVNQPANFADHWRSIGDNAALAKVTATPNATLIYNAVRQSQLGYSDASYIRLKNVALSYGLPEKAVKAIGFTQFRISLQGQNLWTITNYIGRDPESKTTLSMPPLRVYSLGIQASL